MTWYGISVTMVMANRWLFHEWQGVGFPFPVLTTMCHMYYKYLLTRLVYRCKVGTRPFSSTRITSDFILLFLFREQAKLPMFALQDGDYALPAFLGVRCLRNLSVEWSTRPPSHLRMTDCWRFVTPVQKSEWIDAE